MLRPLTTEQEELLKHAYNGFGQCTIRHHADKFDHPDDVSLKRTANALVNAGMIILPYSGDSCVVTAPGIEYVEKHGLADAAFIKHVRAIRAAYYRMGTETARGNYNTEVQEREVLEKSGVDPEIISEIFNYMMILPDFGLRLPPANR